MEKHILTRLRALLMAVLAILPATALHAQSGVNFIDRPLKELVSQAKSEGKPVFVDCYTSWCGPCKRMAKEVFTDSTVGSFFDKHFVSTAMDMEKGQGIELNKEWDINAYPTFIILDAEGKVKLRLTGYFDSRQIVDTLTYLLEHHKDTEAARLYKAGDRSVTVVAQYIDELKAALQNRTVEAVAADFCNARPEELLRSKEAYDIFDQYVTDPYQKAFVYAYANRASLAGRYGNSVIENIEEKWRRYAKRFYVSDPATEELTGYDSQAMDSYQQYMQANGVEKAAEYTMGYKLPASFIIKDKALLTENLDEAAAMPGISRSQFDFGCSVLQGLSTTDNDRKRLEEIRKKRETLTSKH